MNRIVADVMTREVRTLHEEDNLSEIGAEMDTFGFRHLPVVDGERLIGLVTQRDLLRWSSSRLDVTAAARDRSVQENTFVAAVMNRDVATCAPSTPLAEAARRLVTERIGCLPVVDDEGRLVGIVTEHDLLKELVAVLDRPEGEGG